MNAVVMVKQAVKVRQAVKSCVRFHLLRKDGDGGVHDHVRMMREEEEEHLMVNRKRWSDCTMCLGDFHVILNVTR